MLAWLCLAGAQTADRAWRYVYIFGLTIVRAVGMTRSPVGATSVSKVQNYAFFLLKPNYHRFFLTSSLKKHTFYNLLINNILYLCVT